MYRHEKPILDSHSTIRVQDRLPISVLKNIYQGNIQAIFTYSRVGHLTRFHYDWIKKVGFSKWSIYGPVLIFVLLEDLSNFYSK